VTVIESSGVGNNTDETFFFYGHYDKPPPMDNLDHPDLPHWTQGTPYEPKIVKENGETIKIYGRGGADDGYSTYATMVAIKALQ
jgi:acetylornithine deacetylase/succinyl-diaminopimelate desuccinylase-like protein